MKIKDITSYIEKLAPLAYAEDFDNVGLLVGNYATEVTGVLVTLDTLEETVDQAIKENCNLIVSFHPIVFAGLKKFNGSNYVERVVMKAIKNDIAIYATHTALDNSFNGVSAKMCEVLHLKNKEVLIPQKGTIKKLITFVPTDKASKIREALYNAGAGSIGNYSNCSFNTEGIGTFKGNDDSNPVVGTKGVLQEEQETQIGITFSKHLESEILSALIKTHPYEEVAYEITTLENVNQHIGIGMIGELETPLNTFDFLSYVKLNMNTECIRHSKPLQKNIQKVAVLGGSGSFGINAAIAKGADAYITADFKYHEFYKAEGKLLITDIGHYESEQFTKNLLVDYLKEKFRNFAIILSNKSTNPIYYS
ncbi:Nif3-like dinuclear metal center hexameric protein [Wenyingzhuangia aestuarii]|uniref:Nif3-like dinuclear metal center hexameric protein n=1 Tax=Wenyingzhuangia aestuarii TaxID=1647582 RepID=UPI00143BCC9E|nr:Nif3-like dinuclear metal center hexameric protein [Wenyingzhuangia aestuarii]NJB83276.1 dinuclear metal center YbgI/SA1388 family protein [Wenyingzhuangia aestuarii]